MNLHHVTVNAIESNYDKFTEEIAGSIQTIYQIIRDYSAMSDTNFLLHKYEKTIPGIELPKGEASWLPIRNLARIIAKIASMEHESKVEKINLESMQSGCDYFEGNIYITIDGIKFGGAYKWQWTAFADRQRHFDRFTIFPEMKAEIKV